MRAQQRFTLGLLLVAILPLSLATFTAQRSQQRDIAGERDQQLQRLADDSARDVADQVRVWLEAARADGRLPGVVATARAAGRVDAAGLEALGAGYVAAIGGRDPVYINSVAILDLQGRNLVDTQVGMAGTDESAEPYMSAVYAAGLPRILPPYVPGWAKRAGLFVAAPVRDGAATIIGLLRIRLEPASLTRLLDARLGSRRSGRVLRLLDAEGRRIDGLNDGDLPARIEPLPDSVQPLEGAPHWRGVRVAVAGTDWQLLAAEPQAQWQAAVQAPFARWWQGLLLTTLLTSVAAWWLGGRLARPLANAAAAADALAAGDLQQRLDEDRSSSESARLASAFNAMAERLTGNLAALAASREELATLIEQVPGALYRCGPQPDRPLLYLSPRIEAMSGWAPADFLAGTVGLGGLQHELDRERVAALVAAAVAADQPWELVFRVRTRTGELRWWWERGQAQRDADGRVQFLQGLIIDVSEREQNQRLLEALRRGTEGLVGDAFFQALVVALAGVAGVRYASVARLRPGPEGEETTLAFCADGRLRDNRSFPLAGTPGEALLERGRLQVVDAVCAAFPRDAALASLQARGYAGELLRSASGQPIGLIALAHDQPLPAQAQQSALLALFADRAAAEIDRLDAEAGLRALTSELEQRVEQRTRELAASSSQLKLALGQLVQSEKLASLGSLVAGVAHELNTPIGNALTVAGTLQELQTRVQGELASGVVRRSTIERVASEGTEAIALINRNLQRAAALIGRFKQVADDQSSAQRRGFDLYTVIEDVLSTLRPRFKRTAVELQVEVAPGITMDSYPGPLEQVLTNLILNSLVHGFEGRERGRVRIEAVAQAEQVRILVSDDGRGIAPAVRDRIFDPFFTTRLGYGGSGLGLYITYGLVSGRLGGQIRLLDVAAGACFEVRLPRIAPQDAEPPA